MKTYTSESVCSGHPDKICDQISDAVLDAAIEGDRYSRVAVETMVSKNFVAMVGEVTTKTKLNYRKIAARTIKKLGYVDPKLKFTHNSPVVVKIHTQSPEIAVGVDNLGAGDQGMMFGYATDETKEYMPVPIIVAHKLAMKIDMLRESGVLPYLRPDGKTQVTATKKNNGVYAIEAIVLAAPHSEEVSLDMVSKDLYGECVMPVLAEYGLAHKPEKLIVNGTGVWHIGGPASDSGVTGRKIIVDTYGSFAHVGGGAFSGKDPTKVDRSAAYAARFLAKNIVAHGLARRCEVRLAYFIGAKKPVMQEVETFGTNRKSEAVIKNFMDKILDTSLSGIIRGLNLRRPIYFRTASYGHFGREGFPWEKIIEA